jgi:PIN domain nuclease of toxin-antitoxin system
MSYLLDTHYMLWAIAETKKISKKISNILTDPEQRIIVSSISFWEVSLKQALGKLQISGFSAEDLPAACLQIGFEFQPLSPEDASTYHELKAAYHKDPFDRMLIWQAIRNRHTLISADEQIKKYTSEGLMLLVG